ncbi:MAG: SGNH/GDSL hydrolase family protein [Bacillota bacterium]
MLEIQPKNKLLFMGDSITDAGRSKPEGEGLFDPFGLGYVAFANALLNSTYPSAPIRVVNKGISGNTTRDLLARWQEDCIDQKPDWVSIMIGTNDVWRQFDMPLYPENCVGLEEYEQNLVKLIETTKPLVKGIVLCTPFFIESNLNDGMRKRMDEYSAVVSRLAKQYEVIFVNTQAAFDEYLESNHSSNISWDRVHPNNVGHMIIARAFLKAVGYEF